MGSVFFFAKSFEPFRTYITLIYLYCNYSLFNASFAMRIEFTSISSTQQEIKVFEQGKLQRHKESDVSSFFTLIQIPLSRRKVRYKL